MQAEAIIPIILAGGRGTRLRPFVREGRPKPFVRVGSGKSGYSLLQETLIRAACFAPPVIVTHQDNLDLIDQSYDEIAMYDLKPRSLIAEPLGRSTAPAIAAGALSLPPYATFVVMPSDHVIPNDRLLADVICDAASHVGRYGGIVSIGAKPWSASRRYGYLHCGAMVDDAVVQSQDAVDEAMAKAASVSAGKSAHPIHHSKDFLEKPSSEHARICKRSGQYLWNTGIFVARVNDYLAAFQEAAPESFTHTKSAFENSVQDEHIYHLNPNSYDKLPPDLAVDTAIIQKTTNRYAVRFNAYWSDVGTVPSFLSAKLARLVGVV